ncbi:MAG: NAD-binding protein [Epsilonproteobacteria bacterium]|nr:NAD-binding protein [Campylobacterota bacterium]
MKIIDKIKKILHWRKSTKPDIDLNTELYQQFAPFRLPLILVVMMMLIGTLGYIAIEDFPLMDAIFQTGITFTTVGFGEIQPLSDIGRIFTITLIILGFGVFSFSVGILVEVLNKGDLLSILKERSMLYNIARLKNHYVICNHNDYTIQLTQQFRENHIPFVVVDANPNLEEEAKKHNYPYYVQEEPHTELALIKSYLSSAKGVITLSNNIADNIAVIASVRLYEKEIKRRRPYFVMTNAATLSDIEKLKKLGADSVVSPTKLMAQRLSAVSQRPEMENILEEFLYKKDTPLDIEEVNVPSYSWMIFKKLKEINLSDYVKVNVVGIRDDKDKFIPMPDAEQLIMQGSKLLLIGSGESIRQAKKIARKKEKPREMQYV